LARKFNQKVEGIDKPAQRRFRIQFDNQTRLTVCQVKKLAQHHLLVVRLGNETISASTVCFEQYQKHGAKDKQSSFKLFCRAELIFNSGRCGMPWVPKLLQPHMNGCRVSRVMTAKGGMQAFLLDSGQKHAGMTALADGRFIR
jgi:hypothetical protein